MGEELQAVASGGPLGGETIEVAALPDPEKIEGTHVTVLARANVAIDGPGPAARYEIRSDAPGSAIFCGMVG